MVPDNNDEAFSRDDEIGCGDEEEPGPHAAGSDPAPGGGDDDEAKGSKTGPKKSHPGEIRPRAAPKQLPFKVSQSVTVVSLGRVEWINPNFHDEKFIFPIGYK